MAAASVEVVVEATAETVVEVVDTSSRVATAAEAVCHLMRSFETRC